MLSSRKTLLLMAKMALTFAIFWLLYHHSQLQFRLLYTFLDHPGPMLLVVGLCLLMVVFHAWRWYRLNSAQRINLPLRQTLLPAYIAIAFNNVLPGSIGGDFFRLYFVLKKFPTQKSNAVMAIFVDRVTGLLGILVLACIAAPFYLDTFRHNTTLFTLLVVSYSVCAISLVGFIGIIFLLSERAGLADHIEKALQKRRYAGHFLAILEAVHIYRNAKWVLCESLLMSMATQMLLLIAVWQISLVMGLPTLSAGIYILALVIGQIANLVPLTPGGLGVGEAAFGNIVFLLSGGISAYATVFFGLRLLSTLSYLPGVFIGTFGFDLLHKAKDKSAVLS